MPQVTPTLSAALFGGLVLALALMLLAFLKASHEADRQFDLARLSQEQAATMSRIAALAERPAERERVFGELDRLDRQIAAERRLVDDHPRAQNRVSRERVEVGILRRMAQDPAGQAAFGARAAAVEAREAAEVSEARERLLEVHRITGIYAWLLAALVMACAAAGGWLLHRRNCRLQAEVTARRAQIEAVDASRRLFFAKTSHELRTPVQAMRSTAEVALADTKAGQERLRAALEHVVAGTVALGHRIDELLGLASTDNGQLQLHRARTDLGVIVTAALAECRPLADSVDCSITCESIDAPLPVRADPRWLCQALIAVIDNGLKFSPIGAPLDVTLGTARGQALITVTDRGPGVVEAELPRIFDAYYQAESGRGRGGNGLGLALARWVVEQHGGTIGATNLPVGGCRLSIHLPLEPAA